MQSGQLATGLRKTESLNSACGSAGKNAGKRGLLGHCWEQCWEAAVFGKAKKQHRSQQLPQRSSFSRHSSPPSLNLMETVVVITTDVNMHMGSWLAVCNGPNSVCLRDSHSKPCHLPWENVIENPLISTHLFEHFNINRPPQKNTYAKNS